MIIYYSTDFTGGRAESRRLLERAISEYTGDPGRAALLISGLKTGEKGKPYIEGFDHFSVSHTGGMWAVLIGERECGLDIQLGKDCDVRAISRRLYAEEDAEKICGIEDASEAHDEFFRLWTRREALTKAIGGSVYEPDLPSVSAGRVTAGGRYYIITDIRFPGMPDLYSAMCLEDCECREQDGPEFIALG